MVRLPGGFYHVQPHDAVVQFLLNLGLMPTLPALALIGWAMLAAHQACRRDRARLPYLLALDCLLVRSLLDGMLHFALIAAFAALCLADGSTARRVGSLSDMTRSRGLLGFTRLV